MGEHEGWAQPSGLLPNGLLPNMTDRVTRTLDKERWLLAEERTAELISCIQPNQPSEEQRHAVVNYVRQLIMKCFSCQVFTFGSVPLKTYLPDGDIDLTACSKSETLKDTWAMEVRDMLQKEEKSECAEFRVKDVHYIQAEVKLIKCLVENIVVDISFNQVGGLCTLCFLEEIDNLIDQDHLFKRSIILIKAWCYYESRILGAHHGLISTYALETLVLYIFHVFNNSFAGPLEVLYRFLEFFSNFDWDNFCVSLWGPVPISSLPDVTAQPPRRDGGELLLREVFLNSCSTVYGVKQQENNNQPFLSKHFNVIDPLRANNNLGRSVSKGNFFRIRSAFAFGAKSLAKLLDCPKREVPLQVNKFFMNTWQRHGSGHRPDAPSQNPWQMQPSKAVPVEEPSNSQATGSIKKKSDNAGLPTSHELQDESGLATQRSTSQVLNSTSQQPQSRNRTSNLAAVSRVQTQKGHGTQANTRTSNQLERNSGFTRSIYIDKSQKYVPSDYSVNDLEAQGRFQFARTRSSPELTDASAEVLPRGRRNRVIDAGKDQLGPIKFDYSSRKKNTVSEVSGSQSTMSSFDDSPSSRPSSRQSSSHQSVDASAGLSGTSNSYHEGTDFANVGEDLASFSESYEMQEMHQEEQDLVNLMSSSGVQHLNGQVQFPMHFASPHMHLPLPPVLASYGYAQRNMAGILPANVPFLEPSWGSDMQFPQGFASSPLTHYPPLAGQDTDLDEMVEPANEAPGLTEINRKDNNHVFWRDHDAGLTRGFDSDNGGSFKFLHINVDQQSTSDNSSAPLYRSQNQFVRENTAQGKEDHADSFHQQINRQGDTYPNDRNANLRSVPQSSSSRSRSVSDNSRDGPLLKITRSPRDKWGRKPDSSVILSSLYGKPKRGWQPQGSSDRFPPREDNEHRDRVPLSSVSNNQAEGIKESATSVSPKSRSHQLPAYEPSQVGGSDSVVSVAPMHVGDSRQRTTDKPAVVPLTFFPTGPPVPFVTMVPCYNFRCDAGMSDESTSQVDRDEGADNTSLLSLSEQKLDSADNVGQSETYMRSTASTSALDPSHGHKSDILESDFKRHLRNLLYGRSCQNTCYHGSMIYPSPVVMPPLYWQGHFRWEGPGRPISNHGNIFTQLMSYDPRLVPVAPLQSGPSRPSAVFHRFGDEVPRFRGGTGTYLPNPKVSLRDRQYSSTRTHRGNFNHERSDHGDREGSWINAKQRAAGRSHGRNQAEKGSARLEGMSANENQPSRPWNSTRHEQPIHSYQFHNGTLGSTSSSPFSPNMTYSMFPLSAVSSNGVSPAGSAVPSVVMLYPYDQGTGYGSSAESLEFGSLGPVHLSALNEFPQPSDGDPGRAVMEQGHGAYRGGSPRSSPDQPSSPQVQRNI